MKHLCWDYRREDDPVQPKMGPYVGSEATKDWPQRQQDLPAGKPPHEIPMSEHIRFAVLLAHSCNHYMPDSVCACCSEMKAPAEYMLMPFELIPHSELLRADMPRTNAVIRPCCVVHYRSEPREQHKPPPDPVLPPGFTRRGLEAWQKQGHTLPFDQPDVPRREAQQPATQQQGQGQEQQQQAPGDAVAAAAAHRGAGAAAAPAVPGQVAVAAAQAAVRQEEAGNGSDDSGCFHAGSGVTSALPYGGCYASANQGRK